MDYLSERENIRALASASPLARLLVETDAPYITPAPYRGKPNEPAYVIIPRRRLPSSREFRCEVVEQQTMANTMQAFPRWRRREE